MAGDNELLSFDWENESAEDFFGIKEATTSVAKTKEVETEDDDIDDGEQEEKPTKTKPKAKAKEDIEEEDDDSFFGEADSDDDSDDDPDKESGEDTQSGSIYNDVFKDFKEQGIFKHVEIEEGEELDADRLFELQQEEYETEVAARLQAWANNDLDDDAKAFIKFKTQGGSTEEFFNVYMKSTELPTDGDIEDEDYQDDIIRYQLKEEGWDKDEIEDRLAYLTDQGRKQKVAEKYAEKLKEKDQKTKQSLIKNAEAQKQAIKQNEENFRNNLKEVLDTTEDISGFKISKEDKSKILNFLTKKDQKISDTKSVTGFQKKIAEVFQDTNKMILLAKLVQSDFDMSDFEKQAKTKTTRKVKSNLEQRKSLRPNNSGSSLEGSSLAELFN